MFLTELTNFRQCKTNFKPVETIANIFMNLNKIKAQNKENYYNFMIIH